MAILNTSSASITIGASGAAQTALGVITATISLSNELVDVTEIGAIDRSFVSGIRGGTISGTLFYDQGSTAKALLEAATKSGAPLDFTISHASAANGGYTGSFIVENFAPEYAIGDMIRATFSARITGQYTIV
jgi:hypothetical protein